MIENRISIIVALWCEGYFTDDEVVSWADKEILAQDDEVFDPLIELSLKGPSRYLKLPSYEVPQKMEFTFQERFALRLSKLNRDSLGDVKQFITWAARTSMGEDHEVKEVLFGYQLDHYLDYDDIDPVVHFERNIHEYVESSESIVNSLLRRANA